MAASTVAQVFTFSPSGVNHDELIVSRLDAGFGFHGKGRRTSTSLWRGRSLSVPRAKQARH